LISEPPPDLPWVAAFLLAVAEFHSERVSKMPTASRRLKKARN
jgi:hypothetical protein